MKRWKEILIIIESMVIVFLIIMYLLSPVHLDYTKTVQGIYKNDNGGTDNVTLNFDGTMIKEHRILSSYIKFVGDIEVTFEENPDWNFRLEEPQLALYRYENKMDLYGTVFEFDENRSWCVSIITLKEEGNELYWDISIDHNWKYAPNDKKEEFKGAKGKICAPATNEDEYADIYSKIYFE